MAGKLAKVPTGEDYVIRPHFQKKFRPLVVKQCIRDALQEQLSDKEYDAETVQDLAKAVSEAIKAKLKDLELERYKFIVQVVIGEQKGAGAKVNARCLWDSDTDNYAHDIFLTNTMFCVATAFGIFHY